MALVVDPDPRTSVMLSSILTPAGWTIQVAQDNKAVLSLVEAGLFDLIITGEKTSAREDVELLQEIRRVHPHTRMVILTDDSTPADVIASMKKVMGE